MLKYSATLVLIAGLLCAFSLPVQAMAACPLLNPHAPAGSCCPHPRPARVPGSSCAVQCGLVAGPVAPGQLPSKFQPTVFSAAQAVRSSFVDLAVHECRLEPFFLDSGWLYLKVRVLRI